MIWCKPGQQRDIYSAGYFDMKSVHRVSAFGIDIVITERLASTFVLQICGIGLCRLFDDGNIMLMFTWHMLRLCYFSSVTSWLQLHSHIIAVL